MDQQTVLTLFVIVAAVAIVLQMTILLALYLSVRKTSSRMEALADEVKARALPMLDAAQSIMVDSRERIDTLTRNAAEISTTVKSQVDRVSATVDDVVDRTRLQVIRADELVTRTFDKVEETTETVQTAVAAPVRQLTGVLQGVAVGLGAFFGNRQRRQGMRAAEDEELFI
jgi:methyl-accepting chemotaxis protein